VEFHPAGEKLIIADDKDGVFSIDLPTGQAGWRRLFERGARCIRFLNDHKLIVSCGDGSVVCLDSTTGELLQQVCKHRRDAVKIDLSADGRYLATASLDKTIRIFEAKSLAEVKRFSQPGETTQALFFDSDRRLLVSAYDRLLVLDAESGSHLVSIPD